MTITANVTVEVKVENTVYVNAKLQATGHDDANFNVQVKAKSKQGIPERLPDKEGVKVSDEYHHE